MDSAPCPLLENSAHFRECRLDSSGADSKEIALKRIPKKLSIRKETLHRFDLTQVEGGSGTTIVLPTQVAGVCRTFPKPFPP